ncbi:MAG: glycosyltransferase family 9 protein [Planctomycetes bacterium]|nr:glycosyltransferase family 9 protein [Planctomycetota bacterium]
MSAHRGLLALRAPNWVGDLVMATPVFAAALETDAWSDVRILVRAHLAAVLADGPWADKVVPLARDADEANVYRDLAPTGVVLLSNSFGAALRAWRARVPFRAGSALSGRRFLLTHSVVPPSRDGRRVPIPTAHLLRDVAGLAGVAVPDLHPRLAVRDERARAERAKLAARGVELERGYVLCCPGAAFGAAKLWPPERFAAALDALHEEHGWRGVVTGGPGEEPLLEAVAKASKHGAVSLAGEKRDLEGLKELVRGARLLLVGDSGPRWYAAAFDVPCVSVMGPNFPELTASSLELARVVRVEGLECSPCLERVCPLGHHRCMRDLGIDRVLEAARDVLARASAAEPLRA